MFEDEMEMQDQYVHESEASSVGEMGEDGSQMEEGGTASENLSGEESDADDPLRDAPPSHNEIVDWIPRADSCDLLSADRFEDEAILDAFEWIVQRWIPEGVSELGTVDLLTHVESVFGIEASASHVSAVHKKAMEHITVVGFLMKWMRDRGLLNDEEVDRLSAANRLCEFISTGRDLLKTVVGMSVTASAERWARRPATEQIASHFTFVDGDELSPYQNIIIFMLRRLEQERFKRHNGCCYAEILVEAEDGSMVGTYAWESKMEIKTFVYDNVQMGMDFGAWRNFTNAPHNDTNLIGHLENATHAQFPDVEWNYNFVSFRNGVYDLRHVWYPFDRKSEWQRFAEEGQRVWDEMGVGEVTILPPTNRDCSFKYIDHDFKEEWCGAHVFQGGDAYHLFETPMLWKVLDTQLLDDRSKMWLLSMFGRSLRAIGFDNWQVMFLIHGTAGNGKSLLLKMLQSFFLEGTIGFLSAQQEETFGLETLYDKRVIVWPEAKGKLGMPSTTFQSIVTREPVMVPRKHKSAKHVTFDAMIIGATNKLFDGEDTRGALMRRMLVCNFPMSVAKGDPGLWTRMTHEEADFLVLINVVYLHTFYLYKDYTIWDMCPYSEGERIVGPQMWRAREVARMDFDILYRFLCEHDFEFGSFDDDQSFVMTVSDFTDEFMNWRNSNDIRLKNGWQFKEDNYSAAFNEKGLYVEERFSVDGSHPCRCIIGMRKEQPPEV